MKKTVFMAMAAAIAMTSCSQDDLVNNENFENSQAIAFESYLGKSAQSRASVINKESLTVDGFAVNAYYTKVDAFSAESASSYEKFMQNTKVTFNTEKNAWTYSPVKYWPNISGHKVSFFAYAPYRDENITVNESGFSKIDFKVNSDVLKQVDLIYNAQKDITKQDVTDKVKFQFAHALARIGFSVQVVVDETPGNATNNYKLDGNTHINVKEVKLLDKDGAETGAFYKSGTLDITATENAWSNQSAEYQGFTFSGVNFDRTVKVDETEVVQLHKFNQKQNLLNDKSYLMIIPQNLETDGFKIQITYDVVTEGEDGDNSTVTNKITSADALKVDFKQGKAYNFNLILGMTSVRFDAAVTDWVNADEMEPIWLPVNTGAAGENHDGE